MMKAFVLKLWKWYKGHEGVADAHHTKYTDADVAGYLATGGDIGIGTSSPSEKLEVSSAGTTRIRINAGANNAGFKFAESGVDRYSVASFNGGEFTIWDEILSASVFHIKAGKIGIGTMTPTAKIDINSSILRVRTAKTPASAGASGNQGDWCWDANYLYICVSTNTWHRAAHATW